MDQAKIGKFIAQMRKNKNITQRELAEQLGVSDKAVSKWECGNGMPDNVFMLPLCELLGISANELLAGRRLEDERVTVKKYMLKELYGLDAISMERVEMGAGTVVYIAVCKDGKYMIKYASENKMNHPEQEVAVCMHLQKQGIPTAIFVKNRHGAFLSRDENGRLYSVQIFQEGKQYCYHEAPDWLMEQQAQMLGRIHHALKKFGEVPVGIGEKFFEHMTPEHALKSYEKSLAIAQKNGDRAIAEDLIYRINLMKKIKKIKKIDIDLSRVTCLASHGDYIISQLICGEQEIKAVLDWATCCVHPVVWEVFRSFVYASPKCREGEVDIEGLRAYVSDYMQYIALTDYDLKMMPYLFYYQIAVCDYYAEYYASIMDSRSIYLEQAYFSTKLLRWMETNMEQISNIF